MTSRSCLLPRRLRGRHRRLQGDDQHTAEHFARTINKLKGKVTMLFITHQIPRGLQVDEVFSFGPAQGATRMEVVEEERNEKN